MQILRQAQLQRFEDDLVTHLAARFSGWPAVQDPAQLRSLVREGQQLATKFGVVQQFDVRRFLEFRTEYGDSFDTIPWIAKILKDSTLSGSGKMDQLDRRSLFVSR